MQNEPSDYWKEMAAVHKSQLEDKGYNNFKRTINETYFQWAGADGQIEWLLAHTSTQGRLNALWNAINADAGHYRYRLLTALLWEYAKQNGCKTLCQELKEPSEGNPIRIRADGKPISEDLANSILEYASMTASFKKPINTIVEVGAGYGRTAWVFLKKMSWIKYIVIDIEPALSVSKRYLTSQFPQAAKEGRLVFLQPSEINTIPDKSVDLFLNISSYQEMTQQQIEGYFAHADRVCKGYFYMKEWKTAVVETKLSQKDYPVPQNWKRIFNRECAVQSKFFEAMYEVL